MHVPPKGHQDGWRDTSITCLRNEYRDAEYLPGDAAQSDEDLVEHIRNYATGIYHPVGTCKMGSDGEAIVDDHLRVHGIDGLRTTRRELTPWAVLQSEFHP